MFEISDPPNQKNINKSKTSIFALNRQFLPVIFSLAGIVFFGLLIIKRNCPVYREVFSLDKLGL